MSTNFITNKQINNITAKLKALGSSLMFPLILLAFASLVLGITYIFPKEWITTTIISKIAMVIFDMFSYLVFYSLIITFHKEKDKTTLINATLFLFVLISVQTSIKQITNIDEYLLSNSVFSMLLCSIAFIITDKVIKWSWLWVGIGFFYALVLVPILIVVDTIIKIIGVLIGMAPYGLNAFLYGVTNRLLLPFGLHSLMIPTFAYTAVGGVLEVTNCITKDITTISGDSVIWTYMYTNGLDFQSNAGEFMIGSESFTYKLINTTTPGQYQQGFLPLITFILPMMGIGYVITNGWEKGKNIFIATLITMCSGLTEITEYIYLYTNIYLYLLEVFFTGISFMLCNILNVTVWISTGWFIDIILFGLIPNINGFETNWYWIPVIGISIGLVFSILFNLIDKISKKPISV